MRGRARRLHAGDVLIPDAFLLLAAEDGRHRLIEIRREDEEIRSHRLERIVVAEELAEPLLHSVENVA